MGDVAEGIKAFKKGMAEDDKTAEAKTEPVKTIEPAAGAEDGNRAARRERALLKVARRRGTVAGRRGVVCLRMILSENR